MTLNDFHNILFNAHILYSIVMGAWAVSLAVRKEPLSGNFWGALASITILAGAIAVIGVIMLLQGLRPPRLTTYALYMSWLIVLMPGLFSILRGREDRNAAFTFAVLSFFNAATSFSMIQRDIVGPWLLPS